MRGLFTRKTLEIPAGQVMSGIATKAQAMQVVQGRVWVTVEGIDHDYFLHAGDTFTAIPGKLTVIEADRDASIALPSRATPRLLRGIASGLSAFLRGLSRPAVVQASLKRHRTCDAC